MHSITSSALPTALPSGWLMSVITARHALAARRADFHHAPAPARGHSSNFFMNAPEPVLTSSTRPSMPSASFLLIIDAVISGIDSTVAVTSRRA